MAFKVGHGRNFGGLFLRHLSDVVRPITRLLLDESRRTCPPSFFRRPSSVSDALQIKHVVLCVYRPARGIRTCRCHRRNDEYRDLVAFILVCAGIWIMRVRSPELERGFRVPAAPVV